MAELKELYGVTTRSELAVVIGGLGSLIDLDSAYSSLRSVDNIGLDPSGREIISIDLVGQWIGKVGRIPIIHFYKECMLLDSEKRGEIHLAALPVRGLPGPHGFIDWIVFGDIIK